MPRGLSRIRLVDHSSFESSRDSKGYCELRGSSFVLDIERGDRLPRVLEVIRMSACGAKAQYFRASKRRKRWNQFLRRRIVQGIAHVFVMEPSPLEFHSTKVITVLLLQL